MYAITLPIAKYHAEQIVESGDGGDALSTGKEIVLSSFVKYLFIIII